jgi:hypothetical protein
MERADHLSHSLMPLELAVTLVRNNVYASRPGAPSSEPDAIARFIAASVPIYECSKDPSTRPSAVRRDHDGLFRKGGRELHFLDGRPIKKDLAVKADDVECVIAMLRDPERAADIRGEALEAQARPVQDRAAELKSQSKNLRVRCQALSRQCQELRASAKRRKR